jgi:hypothetical protein
VARRGRGGGAALAILIVVAGCGGAASAAPTSEPTPAPTPTATPAPTPTPEPTPEPTIDIAGLGDLYLGIAADMQATLPSLYDEVERTDLDEAELSLAYRALADAYRSFADAQADLEYPPEVQADADELIDVLNQIADEFELSADDPTYDNFDAVNALLPEVPAIGARIRLALGLPPPPTPTPG